MATISGIWNIDTAAFIAKGPGVPGGIGPGGADGNTPRESPRADRVTAMETWESSATFISETSLS